MLPQPQFEHGWNISQMRGKECHSQTYDLPSRHKNNCTQVCTCEAFTRSRFCLSYLYKCQIYGQAVLVSAGYSPQSHLKCHLLFQISAKYMKSAVSHLCHVINNGNECLLNDTCTDCSCKIHSHTFLSFVLFVLWAPELWTYFSILKYLFLLMIPSNVPTYHSALQNITPWLCELTACTYPCILN